jgi:large subunit ribosomal protein L9
MQIILTQPVENLGSTGDTVKVADGYARNFLLPRGLGILATEGNVRRLEALRKKREEEDQKALQEARKIAEKLAKHTVTIAVRTGEDGKMFGAVTASDIANALKADGFHVERRKIELAHPLKEVGEHEVDVKIHAEIPVKLKVTLAPTAQPKESRK